MSGSRAGWCLPTPLRSSSRSPPLALGLALACVILPAIVIPTAASDAPRVFAVVGIERQDDEVRVAIRIARQSTEGAHVELVSLQEGGALVANETLVDEWLYRTMLVVAFRVFREVEDATLVIQWHRYGERGVERIPIVLPEIVEDEEVSEPVADLQVARIARTAAGVVVTLANAGARASSRASLHLEDLDGVVVADPARIELPPLDPGAETDVAFALVDDVSRVGVRVMHEGETRLQDFHLPRAASDQDGSVSLGTEFPTKEASPGGSVSFELRLENHGQDRTLALRSRGLAEEFATTFLVQGSRVPSLRLPSGALRVVQVDVKVPSTATSDVGGALDFEVLVLDETGAILTLQPLTLLMQGTARLELSGQNWFSQAIPGETTRVTITLVNSGTAPSFDIVPRASLPPGWSARFEPARIDRLGAGESREVELRLDIPSNAAAGRFLVDVVASTAEQTARQRSLSIQIQSEDEGSLLWIVLAAGAGLAALGIMVKVKRR